MDLFGQLVTKEVAFVAGAIIVVMTIIGIIPLNAIRPGWPAKVNQTWVWKTFGFLFTVLLGVAWSFMPGVCPLEGQGIGSQITWGVIAGAAAIIGYKALKPAILDRLERGNPET